VVPGIPATVVVLKENAAAQELIEQALRESGDRVLVTADPLEAFELARRVRIDLLVGDVVLIDRCDLEAVRGRSAEHDLRVLYIDGRGEPKSANRDGAITLRSPFSLEELRVAVAVALGRV
jgi:DNA-binding response OmpR family regulator